jgi:hypothetical protein
LCGYAFCKWLIDKQKSQKSHYPTANKYPFSSRQKSDHEFCIE